MRAPHSRAAPAIRSPPGSEGSEATVADKVERIDAAEQRKLHAAYKQYEKEVLQAAAALAPLNVAVLLRQMVAAQQAGRRAPTPQDSVRNCPEGVNPFAAPNFFTMLFMLWMDLKRDEFGTAKNRRAVVRRQFDEIIAAIQETVPRVRKGSAPVGWFEKDQRRRVSEEAKRLELILADLLPRLGRLVDYSTEADLAANVLRVLPRLPRPEAFARTLWKNRKRRGPVPLKKVARAMAAESVQPLDLGEIIEPAPKRTPRKNSRR